MPWSDYRSFPLPCLPFARLSPPVRPGGQAHSARGRAPGGIPTAGAARLLSLSRTQAQESGNPSPDPSPAYRDSHANRARHGQHPCPHHEGVDSPSGADVAHPSPTTRLTHGKPACPHPGGVDSPSGPQASHRTTWPRSHHLDIVQEYQTAGPGLVPPVLAGGSEGESWAELRPTRPRPGLGLCRCLPSVGRSVARAPAGQLRQPGSRVHQVALAHPPSRLNASGWGFGWFPF